MQSQTVKIVCRETGMWPGSDVSDLSFTVTFAYRVSCYVINYRLCGIVGAASSAWLLAKAQISP